MKLSLEIKDKSTPAELVKAEEFRKHIRKTEPHKHKNYFEIIFLSKGSGWHSIDYQTFEVMPPILFFIRREQLHYWNLTSEPEGYVLMLKRDFLDQSTDGELSQLLTKLSSLCSIQIPDYETVDSILKLLSIELKAANHYKRPMIEGLLKSLFAKILSFPRTKEKSELNRHDTFHAFHELLSTSETIKNNVAYYAEMLNTSPQNLNAICRTQTGQSASQIIATFIINEAKRLLEYTSLPVSKIAYELEFKDPSHFIKFFKRHANCTPQSFRQKIT
ncbi:helix-turn-helix transcriptional regulator [Fulvivirga sp.]|uniref:helix-turn-helix domain-containing protein n=1 Tax=Fulvivirga sp. TaxID=1931237 RepID=UPI0032EDEB06